MRSVQLGSFFVGVFTAITASVPALAGPTPSQSVNVVIDDAHLYNPKAEVGSIVVGNPSIADVTVRTNKEIVLFGKMPGATNVYLFDREGKPMTNLVVNVQNSRRNRLTLQAGDNRVTYYCANLCEQTHTIGDGSYVTLLDASDTLGQAANKYSAAQGAATGTANPVSVRPQNNNEISSDDERPGS